MTHIENLHKRSLLEKEDNIIHMTTKIIAIEGCDGVGKETQTKLFEEYLVSKGIPVLSLSFPNYPSPSSELVKLHLAGKFKNTSPRQRTMMYAIDRSLTMSEDKVLNFIKESPNGVILCDRYMSSMIYDTIDEKCLSNVILKMMEIQVFESNECEVPVPDMIMVLDLDADFNKNVMAERKAARQLDKYESDDSFLSKVRSNINRLGEDQESLKQLFNMHYIKCNNETERFSIEKVHELMIEKYEKNFGGK